MATGHSSRSDFVQTYPDSPDVGHEEEDEEEAYDLDDMIGMYEDGFDSVKGSMDNPKRSMDAPSRRSIQEWRPSSAQSHRQSSSHMKAPMMHRRSQSASLLMRIKPSIEDTFAPPPAPAADFQAHRTSSRIMAGRGFRDSADSRQTDANPDAASRPVLVTGTALRRLRTMSLSRHTTNGIENTASIWIADVRSGTHS